MLTTSPWSSPPARDTSPSFSSACGFRAYSLGLRVEGSGFGVLGLGARIWGLERLGVRFWGQGSVVQGLRLRILSSGFAGSSAVVRGEIVGVRLWKFGFKVLRVRVEGLGYMGWR